MKVAFDVQLLMKGEKTGVAWCTENILKLMPKFQNNMQLNCFTLGYSNKQYDNVGKYRELGYSIRKCRWFHDTIYKIITIFLPIPYHIFFSNKTDVTFFCNYIIPPGVKGRKVVIIYDMAYKACPETVRKKTRFMLNIALKKSCGRADKIITISNFSKNEIVRYLGINEEKVVVMQCGVDFSLYHPCYSKSKIDEVLRKHRISRKYLLYLGTLEPRKNIPRLIRAYAEVKKILPNAPLLVLAGKKGWMYDEIFQIVKEMNLEDSILFTGYVDAKDAPLLMCGSEAFLFPSLYEGFGMPPLEAMACKIPVIVSSAASLPEVVGDTGVLVDPLSVESIRNGIVTLLENDDLRSELSNKGYERALKFSWEKAVVTIDDVFRELTI